MIMTLKQRRIKFKTNIKLNHNIILVQTEFKTERQKFKTERPELFEF